MVLVQKLLFSASFSLFALLTLPLSAANPIWPFDGLMKVGTQLLSSPGRCLPLPGVDLKDYGCK